MRIPNEPAWWAEAREMRDEGVSRELIQLRLRKSKMAVVAALDPEYRRRKIERGRVRRGAGAPKPEPERRRREEFVSKHEPRAIRAVIDREAIKSILANREGGIGRAELMRRITTGGDA